MNTLRRKVVRDVWRSRLLFASIALLLATGIAIFVTMYSAFQNLQASEGYTYEALKFADAFYRLKDVSHRTVDRVERTDGVAVAEGRYVRDVPIRQPDDPDTTVVARLISLPDEGRSEVNDVKVRRGSYLPDNSGDGILLDDLFAEHYGLVPGDVVSLSIDGKDFDFDMVGTVTSPEYLWKAKSSVELFVAPGEFAVAFARKNAVDDLLGVDGLINEITVRFEPGVDGDALAEEIDDKLDRYGDHQLTKREDQISYFLLKMDLDGFEDMSVIVPMLFLTITGMVIYALLSRTVQSQRPIIGLLRAEGHSRGQVLRHYLTFTIVIALLGGLGGVSLGLLLGMYLTDIYIAAIHLPFEVMESPAQVMLTALLMALVVCLLAGLLPALAAARTAPAQAMRPGQSQMGWSGGLDRILPMGRLPYTFRLGLRNMARGRWRTVSSLMGVTVAVALIFASVAMLTTTNNAFDVQFDEIQRYDAKVVFTRLMHANKVDVYESWPEVVRAEPIADIPVKMSHGDEWTYSLITALTEDGTLYRLEGKDGAPPLTDDGLYLASSLALQLDVDVGDEIFVESELHDQTLKVSGIVAQPLSGAAFMKLDAARLLLRGAYASGGLLMLRSADDIDAVKRKLDLRPYVLAVEEKEALRNSFRELMEASYRFLAVFITFSVALGVFAVFNSITLNVMERSRELATMLTLGFSRRQVDMLLATENMLMGALGTAMGLALGYILAVQLLSLSSGEGITLDIYVRPSTFGLIGLGSLLVLLLSQLPGVRSLHRIDLAEATKERTT